MYVTHTPSRQGSIAPLLACSSVALFSFVALAIDLGMITVTRTQCQNAADAAALSGTRLLNNKPTANDNDRNLAEAEAQTRATNNNYLNTQFISADVTALQTGLYRYDSTLQRFKADFVSAKSAQESWSTMKVTVQGNQQAYFSKLFGLSTLTTAATAIAVHRPRDIAFILDFSGSMRFGTTGNWGSSVSNPPEGGWMNADPSYPKFGHYQRYESYSTNPNSSATSATPSSRPNPLYATTGYVMSSGELLAPANFTVTTQGGPPCVGDFYFDQSNLASPTTPATPVIPTLLSAAFIRSPLPTASNYEDQSGTYVGDYWPRKNGLNYLASTSWDPTVATGAARNLAELLGWLGSSYPNGYTTATTPSVIIPPSRTGMTPSTPYPDWTVFRDATWEAYGYDMDVSDYRARRPSTHDPRTTLPANTTGGVNGQVKVTSGKFKGFSMGPSYWGKTFFMSPPDPRAAWDWRRKFFTQSNGSAYTVNGDNSTATGTQNINQALLTNGTGKTVTAASGNFAINYPAILTWIKSGPQTLPPNLRAGKVVYYTSIPDDVNTATGTTDQISDKVFWKNYINYVIAATFTGNAELAGHENKGWPEGTTPTIASTSAYTYTSGSSTVTDPYPCMNYLDNPSRPRLHFWFGPATMMGFLADSQANWWSGTIHEAQCWQLKVAINSVLSDIRNNHPNDYTGLCFFSHNSAYYKTIRSPMSQDWAAAKNVLFYPFSLAATASSTSTAEMRPYDNSFNSIGSLVNANIPNANGGTDPNSGFALAYNLLSSSPSVNTDPNKRGRRGAAKVVIFETDGVPNAHQSWQLNTFGYESFYTNTGNGASDGNGSINAMQPAYDIVTQICKPASTTNSSGVDSGFSTPNTPARVYTIGFGDLFGNPSATQQANAKAFLLNIQKLGGTSSASATAIPSDQLIYGNYQTRIDNLRAVMERIMQSGIQVTLIE